MPLESYCANPVCKRRYLLPDTSAGRSVRCKGCGQTFVAGASVTVNAAKSAGAIEPAWSEPAKASATAPGAASTVGNTVGRFAIRGKLGAGAFGTVYRAYDPQLDRVVALKVPNPGVMTDAKRAERFLREAKAAANLRHPHIVPVFDAGKDGDTYYIASAFIEGQPLADSIPEKGVEFERAARLVRELAEALAYAHEQGIVHRDVKPANMMIDTHDRVHLMDFGLASRQDEAARLTNDGAVMGTPAYMSPEQAKGQKGEAQPATDQYAAGVVLYELLTGRTPFGGPPAVVIANVIAREPDPPRQFRPYIPKDLETICLKAMAKKPEHRYADCQELADDLRRWLEGEPITARRMSFVERAVRWARREPKLTIAIAVLAAVLLGSVVVVSTAARNADSARRSAEQEAIAARAAEKRAEALLNEAQEAREGEERAAGEALGALGTAAQERKKAEGFLAQVEQEKKKSGMQLAEIAQERKRAESWRKSADEQKLRADAGLAQFEQERKKVIAMEAMLDPLPPSADRHAFQAAFQAYLENAPRDALALLHYVPEQRRTWEWRHLQKLCDPLDAKPPGRVTISIKDESIQNFALSADGKWILLLSGRTRSRWDTGEGRALVGGGGSSTGKTTYRVGAINADGTRLFSAGDSDISAEICNEFGLVSLRRVATVRAAAFNPAGTRLVTACADQIARVWDAKDGTLLLTLKGHTRPVVWAEFSPDGQRVVTTGEDQAAMVWNAKDGTLLCVMKGAGVRAAFNADGTELVTAGNDFTARVWNAKTGRLRLALKGHTRVVRAATFSPDGERIVTAGEDQTARMWSTKDGTLLFILKGGGVSAAFSPDGTRVVTAGHDKTVRVWDAAAGRELLTFHYPIVISSTTWSRDGAKIVICTPDEIEIRDGGPVPKP